MKAAYLGLGSNLGNRLQNLRSSLQLLSAEPGLIINTISPVYETQPVGGPMQGPFLNACVSLFTNHLPVSLLHRLLSIENIMGRSRTKKWGARIIDLDLLIYEAVIMNTPVLQLPHPLLTKRDFVLIPLADIAPNLLITGSSKTVGQVLSDRDKNESVVYYAAPEKWSSG